MPPRRVQRAGDDEHPAAKAAALAAQKKKPQQPQQKKKPPPRKAHPSSDPTHEVEREDVDPKPLPISSPPLVTPSVRKSRRQQREEEELEALTQSITLDNDDDNGDDDFEVITGPSTTAFANLQLEGDSDQKKPKKKKKKRVSDVLEESVISDVRSSLTTQLEDLEGTDHPLLAKAPRPKPASSTTATTSAVVSSLKPKPATDAKSVKKQKKKQPKVDEFEAALAELAKRVQSAYSQPEIASAPNAPGPALSARAHKFCDLLAVSLKDLDATAELKRFFGARVIQSSTEVAGPSSSRRAAKAKGVLVQPQNNWPPPGARHGLSVVPTENQSIEAASDLHGGERWWTVKYDDMYMQDTLRFVSAVKTMDPQNLVDLMYRAPWHADVLLQVSEYYRHREEHAPASDLVERAVYAYERALAPGPARFAVGRDRLDFSCAENRPLFLALSRHVVNLIRRGVSRAAFETARFLLALDPWTDPHAAMLQLDFLALKAGHRAWLLQMWEVWPEGVRRWPGWWYARVLCLDKDDERKAAIREAVAMFPEVLPLLADKVDVVLPSEVLIQPAFRIALSPTPGDATQSVVHLLAHIYADRNADLWKDHGALLRSAVIPSVPNTLPERGALEYSLEQQDAVYRHVVQFEARRTWQAFLAPRVRARVGYLWDPLPPAGSAYEDGEFLAHLRVEPEQVDENVILEQLRPLWQQMPHLAELFPNPMQFMNMLQDAPAEALAILHRAGQPAQADPPAAQQAPPQHDVEVHFPGDIEHLEQAGEVNPVPNDDDSSESEDETRDTRGVVQRLFDGFFGWPAGRRAGQNEDESDSESSEGDPHERGREVD